MLSTSNYPTYRHSQKRPAAEHPMAPRNKNPRGHENRRHNNYRQNYHQKNRHYASRQEYYRQPFGVQNYQQVQPLMNIQLAPPTLPKVEESNGMSEIMKYLPLLKSLQNQGFLATQEPPKPAPISEDDIWNQLAPRNQRIRDQSKIDALLQKRPDSCERCGLNLGTADKKSKVWKDHMDYHFELNMGDLLQRKPVHLVNKQQPFWSGFLTGMAPKAEPAPVVVADVESTGVVAKSCTVCCEKFDEYYDDDEETWRFKNSMRMYEQIIHKTCSDGCSPLPKIETPQKSEVKEEVKQEIIWL